MSPTARLAQLDHLSPVEDLDLDEMDLTLMNEEEDGEDQTETPITTTPVGETFGNAADKCGLYYLTSPFHFKITKIFKILRCVCPSFIDRKKRISKSYRTCRSNTNQSNCCAIGDTNDTNSPLIRDAASNEQRHLGGRELNELHSGTGSNINSRSRPLYIPSHEWSRHNNEPGDESSRQLLPDVQVQQPKRQERPTELILPTKQFENGHTNSKSQASTYMEQFWICTKR